MCLKFFCSRAFCIAGPESSKADPVWCRSNFYHGCPCRVVVPLGTCGRVHVSAAPSRATSGALANMRPLQAMAHAPPRSLGQHHSCAGGAEWRVGGRKQSGHVFPALRLQSEVHGTAGSQTTRRPDPDECPGLPPRRGVRSNGHPADGRSPGAYDALLSYRARPCRGTRNGGKGEFLNVHGYKNTPETVTRFCLLLRSGRLHWHALPGLRRNGITAVVLFFLFLDRGCSFVFVSTFFLLPRPKRHGVQQ